MIKNFKHKGLMLFFTQDSKKLLNSKQAPKIKRVLDRLDMSETEADMNLPGYHLHRLKGSRKNVWSVWISGNWRITFQFEKGDAYNVNLEDYH